MENTMKPSEFWPPAPDLQRAQLQLQTPNNNYLGHLVAPARSLGPRPLVLVVHNYQGLKFFDVDVAEYLARVGYVGLAVDMYGETVPPEKRVWPDDPAEVEAFQRGCFEGMVSVDHDHGFFRSLLARWLELGKSQDCVDASFAPAVIGYCFGGVAAIECVRGGLDVSAAVSFHGLLQTGEDRSPEPYGVRRPALIAADNHYNTRTLLLIENGAEDHLVGAQHKARFLAEMDAAGVDWVFHDHARTPHGFALPPTLGPPGHLHEASDRRSTMNMLSVFREVFDGVPQASVAHNAAGTRIPSG
jgi:dienelactone hydrolase